MDGAARPRISWLLEHTSRAVAVISMGVGAVVLVGWAFDIDAFKSVAPGLTAMKANAALGFILAGIALWCAKSGTYGCRLAAQGCAGLVLLIGVLVLGEYLTGRSFGIDELLVPDITNLPGDIPGRPAVNTAIGFAAMGTALLLLNRKEGRSVAAIHVWAIFSMLVSGAALVAYVYDLEALLREELDYTPMALHTAATLLLLGFGVLTARPDYPLRLVLSDEGPAGADARRLLPVAVGLPLAAGWLISEVRVLGYLAESLGPALVAMLTIATLGGVVIWNALDLRRTDLGRRAAEEAGARAAALLRNIIDSSTDYIFVKDRELRTILCNTTFAKARARSRPEDLYGRTDIENGWDAEFVKGNLEKGIRGWEEDDLAALSGETVHRVSEPGNVQGHTRFFDTVKLPLRSRNGDIVGMFGISRDVTERKLKEDELARYREQLEGLVRQRTEELEARLNELEAIYASAPVGLAVLDTSFRYLRVNARLAEIDGVSREAHLGKTLREVVPHLAEQAEAAIRRIVATGEPVEEIEFVGQTPAQPDVQRHWLERWTPIKDKTGKVRAINVMVEETTERKRAEARLFESARLLDAIMEFVPEGITIAEAPSGRILRVSRYGQVLLGGAHERLTAAEVAAQWQVYEPDGVTPMPEAGLPLVRALRQGERLTDVEVVQRNAVGRLLNLSCNAAPIRDQDGNITGAVVAWRDIGEIRRAERALRESEARFRNLFENIEEMVTVYEVERDDRGRIVERRLQEANRAFLRAVGVSSVDDIRGKTSTEILGRAWSEQHAPAVQKSMDSGQVQMQEIHRPESGRYYITTVVRLDQDTYLSTGWDITERKEAELALKESEERYARLNSELRRRANQLEEANSRLVELDRLKSMFLASMSHELRTPLHSIIGFTGIVLQGQAGTINDEQRKQLGIVKKAANHLLALINDVLDIAKIETEQLSLAVEEFDVAALAQEVAETARGTARDKGLALSVAAPQKLLIASDRRRVKQILANLLDNAVKFTDSGRIVIGVTGKADAVDIAVQDSGIGIGPKDMPKLFVAFSQIVHTDRLSGGSGIGLYLSQKIARLLGGAIVCESKAGQGSTFTLSLPRRMAQ